jgi:TP901 family phage tail tape measure protein
MAAERTVYIKVGAKVEGAVAGIRKVKASVDDLTKSDLKKPQAAFDGLSTKAALAGGAVALGVGKAIKSFADFDQQMSAVRAALPDAASKMGDLRDLAVKLGQDTQFSATEAAQGITEMAKAGVSAGDILNGGLKGGLDLAAAGQLDVARASEIAATALNQFNLEGRDVSHVADLYAAAAGKAQGSVEDIAQAMKYAGVTAASMGISIEETTGVIGLFASKGIIGEQAGTSFRSMLLSLTSPSKIAATAMQELGINVYDAQGKFVGMQGAAQILQEKLGPLDEATRNQALGQIFGNESMNAAIALYQGGGKAVQDWTAKVNDAGYAQKQASALTDNLKGDIERLGGSIETAFITSGSSANGALRTLTQGLEGFVNKVGAVPGPVLLASAALAGIALTLPRGLKAYRDFTKSLDTLGISMDKISTKAPRTARALSIVGKAAGTLAVAATAVYAFQSATDKLNGDKLSGDLTKTGDGLAFINEQLAGQTDNGWGRVGSDIDSFGKVLGATFDPGIINNIDNTIGSLKTVFGGENVSNIQNAAKQLNGIDAALAGLVTGGNAEKAKIVFSQMTKVAQDQGITVDQLKEKFPQYAAAVAGAEGAVGRLDGAIGRTSGSASSADGALQDLAADGLKDVEGKAKDAKKEMENLLNLLDSMAGGKRAIADDKSRLKDAADAAVKAAKDRGGADPEALAAQKKAQERLAKAKKGGNKDAITSAQENLVAANKRVADSFVAPEKAQRDYEQSMRDTAAAGDALIHDLIDQKKPISDINAAYDAQRAALIKAAEARGFHGDAAVKEADKVGITVQEMDDLRFQYANTQEYVDTQVRTPGLPQAKANVKGYWDVINGVPTFHETKFSALTGTASQRISELKAELAAIPRNINTLITVRKAQNEVRLAVNGVPDYATGGYTGSGGKYEPAGVVHRGEVVMEQEVVRREGLARLMALRAGRAKIVPGYADGGYVGARAYRAAPPSALRIDYGRLAAARSGDNFYVTTGDPVVAARRVSDEREWKAVNGF